jgi:arylsulfatase A-like enzyme
MLPSRRLFLAALAPAPRPNILFIMADDLGYADLSCYGRRDYQTPHLDRLAAQGVRFTQAYANGCVCSPTRTALFTGRYQYRLPVGLEEPIANRSPEVGVPPSHPTLSSLFRAAGYHTSLVGKWHLGTRPGTGPLESGYHEFFGYRMGGVDYFTHKSSAMHNGKPDLWDGNTTVDRPGYLTDLLADRAEAILKARAKDRQPFLLSLHFSAPHWPWQAPGDAASSAQIANLTHWDGGSNATYARMVQVMDQRIGRLLQTLEDQKLARNTIVVFTSDNGGERFSDNWPFSGHKAQLLEGGIRVPAIIRWPGHIRPGTTTSQVAITMDWLPTLLAAANLQPDPAYPSDGVNLLPSLNGPLQPRTLFWRHRADQQRALRQGDWKLLRLRKNSYLFNLAEDPLERANRKAAHPDVFARLNATYDAWNATMLPEDPNAFSYVITGDQQAESYGHTRPER